MVWPASRRNGTQGTLAEDIEQRAAEWLVRLEADTAPASPADLEAFLAQHPRYKAAYTRLSAAWRRFDGLAKLKPLDGAVDADLLEPGRR